MGIRACGILFREGKVLLQRKVHEMIWAVPGGRVEEGETVEGALSREFMEELGWAVHVGRRLWVFENSFEHDGELITQIEHYFQIMVADPPMAIETHDATLAFCWASRREFEWLDLRPKVIRDMLIATALF